MSEEGAEAKQEQSVGSTRRFILVKKTAMATPPYPTSEPRELPPNEDGDIVYETDDIEWFTAHVQKGDFKELLTYGKPDGTMSFSVLTGAIEGEETTFIVHFWDNGKCYDIPIPDADILSQTKLRHKIFAACGKLPKIMKTDVWEDKCKEMYKVAVERNDVNVAEFHELPLYLDFVNYIEEGNPVLDKNDLSLERGNVIWYDVTINEIRPLRKHFDELITNTPGMTSNKFSKIIKKLLVRNADQVHLGKEDMKYAYWVLNPDFFPKFMAKVRALLEDRRNK